MKRYARKVKGKLTTVFDPDHLARIIHESQTRSWDSLATVL